MSSTLTWQSSGNGTQTGTTALLMMTDLVNLINSYSGNAAFKWQVAGSSLAGTPFWVVLSRKDGSAGRIAVICLTTAFTNINPTLWEQLPAINNVFFAWFPAGTGSTLSNLNATSGTICGNDTGAPYASSFATIGTSYGAGFVWNYWDSAEAVYFQTNNPTTVFTGYSGGAGALLEDSAGTTYDATCGSGSGTWSSFGTNGFNYLPISGKINAGALPNSVSAVYGGVKKQYYVGLLPTGGWASLVDTSTDSILADNGTNKVWFAPVNLLTNATKGEGSVLKMRQVGYGPGRVSAYAAYVTTGPVTQAQQMCSSTSGSLSAPWLTNFKI